MVDDSGVSAKTFREVEEEYYRRYFRSRAVIDAEIAATLHTLKGDDDTSSSDTIGNNPDNDDPSDGRSDDYDVF